MCGICGTFALTGELGSGNCRLDSTDDHRVAAIADPTARDSSPIRTRRSDTGGSRSSIARAASSRMSNEDGSCWIVFNGEIYNHHEIRHRLDGKGHHVPHALRHRSHRARLRGVRALRASTISRACSPSPSTTSDARELFIARDRLGKKPLFYAAARRRAAFRQRDQSDSRRARPGTVAGPRGARRLPVAWLLSGAAHGLSARAQARAGPLAARAQRIDRERVSTGTSRRSTISAWTSASARRRRSKTQLHGRVRERLESEVPLGRLSFRRDRLRARRVVHGGGAPRSRRDDVGRVSAKRAHNELDAAAVTAARFQTEHYPHLIQPRARGRFRQAGRRLRSNRLPTASALPTYYVSRKPPGST